MGFITPNLLIGGVEHWFLGVLQNSHSRIEWSAAVTNPSAIEPEMRARTEEFAPVGIGPDDVRRLVGEVDAIVTWGIFDLARLLGDFRGPVVLVSHGCCEWTRSFVNNCRRVATHFVAVSEAAASAFGESNATIIPNGVDARRCRPTRTRDELRREWGLGPDEIAVGFVGRLSPEKNPLATSQAVAALGPGHRAVYVGRGYGVDLRAAALQITPDAIFIPPMHQVGNAYRALDCVLVASPSEGFSMVLVEAMLCGVPVVSTRVGVVPELERDHGIRLIAVPINPAPAQLAEAVRSAIGPANRGLATQLQAIVAAQYTAESMGSHWADYLLTIAGG